MSIELSLLKLFCDDRQIESSHHGYLDTLDNLEREVKLLFNLVHSYYKEFEQDAITEDDLIGIYSLKYPKSRDRDLHLQLITEAFSSTVSLDLMKAHLDQVIEQHHATSVVNKLIPVMEGDKYGVLDSVREDVDSFIDILHNPPDRLVVPTPCTLTVEELIENEINDAGIPWHLSGVTDIIGGLRRKTLGLIYAFVDSGKTSFTMAACTNFASYLSDTEDTIVYCGNEESADRLQLRLVQAFTNWNRKHIKANGAKAQEIANEKGIDRVKVFDSITTGQQLEYVLKEYKPHICFIDQAPGIELHGKEEGVSRLESLFKWYRKLCNMYNVGIVGVAQGTGEAEDSKYLKLSDIYGARVAIQAALDWACGIGRKVNNPIDDDLRYLNFPKNKLNDGDGGRLTVHFDKYLCEWQEN